MQILFDTKIQLNASIEQVWDTLVDADTRHQWQDGVSKAELVAGTSGYRGALTRLTLSDSGETVVENVHRSRPLERLDTKFKIGDSTYQQIVYLTRLDDDKTQLTYHCKQEIASGWRRILNIRPSVPACVQVEAYENLAKHFDTVSA